MTQVAETGARQPIEVEDFALRSLRESWDAFKADPALYILGGALAALVSVLTLGILAGPMIVGFIQIVQRRRRGQSARAGDVRAGRSVFASSFIAFLLFAVAGCIGFALLVVPGLLVMIATCFAFHEIAYRGAHAADALRASYQLARDNLLHVLVVLIGVAVLNSLGGVVVIAILLTAPLGVVWMTVAYELLTGQTPGRPADAVVAEPMP